MGIVYLVWQLDCCALVLLSSTISFSLEVSEIVVSGPVFLSRCQI